MVPRRYVTLAIRCADIGSVEGLGIWTGRPPWKYGRQCIGVTRLKMDYEAEPRDW